VILANSATVVDAFKRATDSVPIVFALDMDPVGLGHVKSLSHPGGNFTGFTFIDPELIGKWTELLKDLSPRLTRAAVLYNPKTLPMYENFVRELTASGQPGAAEVALLPVQSDGEMEAAIRSLGERAGSGLSSDRTRSIRSASSRSPSSPRSTGCPPSRSIGRLPSRAGSWPTARTPPTSFSARLTMWTAS
jgi:hypothetical protein